MYEIEFEEKLRSDGYTEIETQDLQPRPAKGQHGHPFSIRGLVIAGTFIVTQDDQRTTYGPGQVFAVDHGHPHDESIGPEGARVLVGRKYAKEWAIRRLVELGLNVKKWPDIALQACLGREGKKINYEQCSKPAWKPPRSH